jgi:hypothetical protein
MVLRGYANLKDAVDRRIAGQSVEIPDVPMVKLVLAHVERLALERANV